MVRQRGGTRGAIALTKVKQRRAPALITSEVKPDKAIKSISIAHDAVKLLCQIRAHAAVSGSRRINKDQIGAVQDCFRILNCLVGRRWNTAIFLQLDLLWT